MSPSSAPVVRRGSSTVVRPLRARILRPGREEHHSAYDQDDTVAVHVAAYRPGTAVPDGVGTIYAENPPEAHRGEIPDAAYGPGAAWRLRGMATSDAARGKGLGRLVLEECFAVIRERGGHFLWCNARIGAVAFYERLGLDCVGPEFDIPEIGPHYVMWREVSAPSP